MLRFLINKCIDIGSYTLIICTKHLQDKIKLLLVSSIKSLIFPTRGFAKKFKNAPADDINGSHLPGAFGSLLDNS